MKISLGAVINARCPKCKKGSITKGLFGIHKRCPVCDQDFYPEPGYFLGAMMISYMATAMLIVPTVIALKIAQVETNILFGVPAVEYLILGPLLMIYSRVLWLHIEFGITDRLDGDS